MMDENIDSDGTFSSRASEMLNRNEFVAPFLRANFIPYIPEFDEGVDFILYRERDDVLLKVQLKGRWTVDRKYLGRGIWTAFPLDDVGSGRKWYLVPHDKMTVHGKDRHGHTTSWERGGYSKPRLGREWAELYPNYEVTVLLGRMTKSVVESELTSVGSPTW